MPFKLCLEAGCGSPAEVRGRCREHYRALERDRNRRRRSDPNRGARVKLYHSKKWLVTRRRVLFGQPVCAIKGCLRLASDVDHIVPLGQGGAELDRRNLQGLCAYHHALKSGGESAPRTS